MPGLIIQQLFIKVLYVWFPKRCLSVLRDSSRAAFPNHIFNIIGPWLLVLGAFVYVQYPTCTLRRLLFHESPGDMEPEL